MASDSATEDVSVTSSGLVAGDNPIHHSLLLLILQVGIIILLSRSLGLLMRPFKQPRVVAGKLLSYGCFPFFLLDIVDVPSMRTRIWNLVERSQWQLTKEIHFFSNSKCFSQYDNSESRCVCRNLGRYIIGADSFRKHSRLHCEHISRELDDSAGDCFGIRSHLLPLPGGIGIGYQPDSQVTKAKPLLLSFHCSFLCNRQ